MGTSPQTFIFIGRSGCGKGTQADLLSTYIREVDSQKRDIFYMEIGKKFREYLNEDTYTTALSKEVYKKGDLQPDFLAIHIWSHSIIADYNGLDHMIVDGIPRSLIQANVFETAMNFYNKKEVIAINLDVSEEWSRARLAARGRADDKDPNEIENRLAWFKRDVIPAIDYFRENNRYRVLDIHGEQSIEEVHKEIISKITL